jgi:hypothetical protein
VYAFQVLENSAVPLAIMHLLWVKSGIMLLTNISNNPEDYAPAYAYLLIRNMIVGQAIELL